MNNPIRDERVLLIVLGSRVSFGTEGKSRKLDGKHKQFLSSHHRIMKKDSNRLRCVQGAKFCQTRPLIPDLIWSAEVLSGIYGVDSPR